VAFVPPTTTPPLPEPIITADNLTTLRLLRAIGYGHVVDAASAPGGKLLAVATTAGVALFELPTLRHVRFVPLVGGVRQVALSPDGQRLVADTALLRVADGTRLADLTGQTPRFSPYWQLVVTLQQDKAPFTIADLATLTTHLWRSADGTSLLTLPGYAAAFSPDGRLLALTTGTSVQLVRLPDGQAVRTLALETSDYVKDLAFSADGQVLRVALVSELQEWRVADGRHTRTQAIGDTGRSYVDLDNVVLSPAGDVLATAFHGPEGPNATIALRRTADGSPLYDQGSDQVGGTNQIRFSADGSAALLWSNDPLRPNDSLRVLDTRRGTTTDLILPGFAGLTFSPDAQSLAAFSSTRVYLWRVTDGTLQNTFGTGLSPFAQGQLQFAPDGRLLALAGDEVILYGDFAAQLVVWDLQAGGTVVVRWNEYLATIRAFSPMGTFFKTDRLGHYLVTPTRGISVPLNLSADVTAAAFSPDSGLLGVGDRDGSVQLLRMRGGARVGTLQAGGAVNDLFFSSDGTLLGVRRVDGLVQVWRIGESTPFVQLAVAVDDKLIVTADNQMVISGGRGGVTFYRLSDGKVLHKLDVVAQDIAIGPRRRLLAILRDGQAELWGVGP